MGLRTSPSPTSGSRITSARGPTQIVRSRGIRETRSQARSSELFEASSLGLASLRRLPVDVVEVDFGHLTSGYVRDDLPGVEAAVLDEPSIRIVAAAHGPGKIDSASIRLERRLVEYRRTEGIIRDLDVQGSEEFVIRMITRHRQHPVVRQLMESVLVANHDDILPDFLDDSAKVRVDASFRDAILQIRPNPVFDLLGEVLAAHDERDRRAVAVAIERGFCGRISRTNHRDFLLRIRVRFLVVMGHFRKVLTGHIQEIRPIEKPCGHDDVPRRQPALIGYDSEIPFDAVNAEHPFIEPQVQPLDLGHAPIVFECLLAHRLVPGRRKGMATDLDELRCREELHVGRISENGVHNGALLDHHGGKATPPGLDGGRQAHGHGAYDGHNVGAVRMLLRQTRVLKSLHYNPTRRSLKNACSMPDASSARTPDTTSIRWLRRRSCGLLQSVDAAPAFSSNAPKMSRTSCAHSISP